ncbi:radical SAM protein [Brevibacillus sp. 179-C9.3 HS]|uniref:radical SAM protein n=1 Tax=unclassified Brevibacillus TaxID=2684853 RepID=UPI00399F029E
MRISVTDRSNLRCVYCMPADGMEFEPDENILSLDEITEVVRVLAEMGVKRLRLTADGNIKPCLYWSDEFIVRKCIGDDEAVREIFFRALSIKPRNHEMAKAFVNRNASRW